MGLSKLLIIPALSLGNIHKVLWRLKLISMKSYLGSLRGKYTAFNLEFAKVFLDHKNSILLSKLFWPTVRKNEKCSSVREKLKAKNLRSQEQFIQTVKGQSLFCYRMCFFLLVPGGFLDVINQNNYNSNWKKILGCRNLQEKLEKVCSM